MTRTEHIVSVFVASPSDVADERARLEEIVAEINNTWAAEMRIRLELIRWETHAFPGKGEDAQAVINEEIPDNYDIFFGLMWHRFGTPTKRAGSGTEEEFSRAKTRHDKEPSAVKIMFYFKDAPVAPSKLDTAQLNKVQAFKKSLGEEGVLHWTFTDLQSFEALVRLHLQRQLQAYSRSITSPASPSPSAATEKETNAEPKTAADSDAEIATDEEPGILDLAELIESRFNEVKQVTERLASSLNGLQMRFSVATSDVNRLMADTTSVLNRIELKKVTNRMADDLDKFATQTEADVLVFGENFKSGMDSFIRSTALTGEYLSGTDSEEVRAALAVVRLMIAEMGKLRAQIVGFRGMNDKMPPMTSNLIRAKRHVSAAVDKLADVIRTSETLGREAETSLSDILNTIDSGNQ